MSLCHFFVSTYNFLTLSKLMKDKSSVLLSKYLMSLVCLWTLGILKRIKIASSPEKIDTSFSGVRC